MRTSVETLVRPSLPLGFAALLLTAGTNASVAQPPASPTGAQTVRANLATFDDLDFNVFSNQKWDQLSRSHASDILVHWPDGHMGHVVMENRHGLVVGCGVTQATGTAEREAAEALLAEIPRSNRATVGGDKGYDTRAFVKAMRTIGVTPHVAQNTTNRASAIDCRTTRYSGYGVSQLIRKAVEHPSAGS